MEIVYDLFRVTVDSMVCERAQLFFHAYHLIVMCVSNTFVARAIFPPALKSVNVLVEGDKSLTINQNQQQSRDTQSEG